MGGMKRILYAKILLAVCGLAAWVGLMYLGLKLQKFLLTLV